MLIALVFAVLVQTGMVMTFHRITGGCFCSVTGAPSPPIPPAFAIDFLRIAARPASELPFVIPGLDFLRWWDFSLAEAWAVMLTYAAINAVFWFAGAFGLMQGIVFLLRILHPAKRAV